MTCKYLPTDKGLLMLTVSECVFTAINILFTCNFTHALVRKIAGLSNLYMEKIVVIKR